jgi:branched-chain amino acid transport system substrate-binding protein
MRGFGVDRRGFLKLAGLSGAAAGLSGTLAACGNQSGGPQGGRVIKLGYVSPQTGVLAGFGEADNFVLDRIRKHLEDGLDINGTAYGVDILVQDSQSDPDRAAQVARTLIDQEIDILLVASTPETTNPVSAVCEEARQPCISAVAPWQSWYLGRPDAAAAKDKGYAWTYHFFWGLEDLIGVYTEMWEGVPTNKLVGALWPDDGDGKAFQANFPDAVKGKGYRIITPPEGGVVEQGRYQPNANDFSKALRHFADEGVEIVTGVPTPPDFATFWKQAADLDFQPKIVTAAKALLFPSFIEALTPNAEGVSTELWWSPSHPYTSSLTGQSSRQVAEDYVASTDKQWTQPIGFVHALFEVAANVLQRASGAKERETIRDAIADTRMDTIVGPVGWRTGSPTLAKDAPNVSKTPLVGGQWRGSDRFPFDVVSVTRNNKAIQAVSSIEPLG